VILLSGYPPLQAIKERRIVEASRSNKKLIRFLQEELEISSTSIAIALRRCEHDPGPLPMILWQYGLVSIEQLERIFDWLEK
jgi:hypothetical protein